MAETFIENEDQPGARAPRARHAIAMGASVAAHALAILALVMLAPRVERPHTQWVLAYIVELGGDGGIAPRGAGGGVKTPPAAGPIVAAPVVSRRPLKPAHKRQAASLASEAAGEKNSPAQALRPTMRMGMAERRFKTFADRPACPDQPYGDCNYSIHPPIEGSGGGATGSAPNAGTPNGAAGGNGSGNSGSGSGSGNSSAHAEYGRNPAPPYPSIARRHAQQGTVTLRVLVAIDGAVERVELLQSSGVDSLDDSAIETVRTRWRFVPARRDGGTIESWVVVPITFTLTDVSND